MEVLAASAIAVCCLALAIHPTLRPGAVDAPVTAAAPVTTAVAVNPAKARPRIEVVFVLDTTGSMSGLLEGAKQKIWAIANRLASGEPRPELRIGLVAYRDLEDEYVTRRFDFSADMDAVYAELLAYEAGGGGDTPEHVGRGLDEALNNMQWSGGQDTLRLVFLVGDAPPHDDYQDASTATLANLAGQRGIIINTVQCGVADDTEAAWRRIAAAAGGEFTRIAQDGGVVTVATPFDERLAQLNGELAATVLSWGSADAKRAAQVKYGNRMSMSTSNAAEAASYSAKAARMNDEDLLGTLDEGKALADIPHDQLPEVLQGLSAAAQQQHIDDMRGKRSRVNEAIRAVSAERDAYLRDNERKAGADGGFDGKVTDTLRRQAAAIGVVY